MSKNNIHRSWVVAAASLICVSAWGAEPNKDLNGDTKVDKEDAIVLATAILNETATVEAHDFNKDGKVDVADVIVLLKQTDVNLDFGGEEENGVAEAPKRDSEE